MKRSQIEAAQVRQYEVIASFGEARLVKMLDGTLELRGGSEEDRRQERDS